MSYRFFLGRACFRVLFAAMFLVGAATFAQAQLPALTLEPVTTGLSSPLTMINANDGSNRLFIVQKGGQILILQNGSVLATPFLSIPNTVLLSSGSEQGLLGLAFHPQYAQNRRFFVFYTRQPDGAITVAEYRVSTSDPNIAETTGTPLIAITKPAANHNGGTLAFGPDGLLYLGTGDGGGAGDPDNNAQNINSLLGKILRIDVDQTSPGLNYGIPPDNPFAGATAGADEIYATGMRNPYRFSFDKRGTALYAGDVGQGAREEVDIITRGGNYGWRITEGNLCFNPSTNCDLTGLTAPIHDYGRGLGCSVIGGYVYRGTRIPGLVGVYIFADFCSGRIFAYNNGTVTEPLNVNTVFSLSGFGEDEAGELYVTLLNGSVFRIGAACSHTASPTSSNIAATGGSGNVSVTSTAGCGWQAVSNVPWITVQSGNSGTGNGTVQYQVAGNSGPARKGAISVAGNLFVVTQAAPDCGAPTVVNSLLSFSGSGSVAAPTCGAQGYSNDYVLTTVITNTSSQTICNLSAQVVELSHANGSAPAVPFRLISADGATCVSGGLVGSVQTIGSPTTLAPGQSANVTFRIALSSLRRIRFTLTFLGGIQSGAFKLNPMTRPTRLLATARAFEMNLEPESAMKARTLAADRVRTGLRR